MSAGETDVAHLIGSSRLRAGADDRRKDMEILGWLEEFEPEVRDKWLAGAGVVRGLDRMVESARRTGEWKLENLEWAICAYLRGQWLSTHTGPIATMQEHDVMLRELGGGAFQLLPFLGEHWEAVADFGALDQFWNNVRDLREDLDRGLCFFPQALLDEHRIFRGEILRGSAIGVTGWYTMLRWWLDVYAPRVRERARPFLGGTGLHPSWERFRAECLRRHKRIELVFRACEFDYLEFERRYWA